MSSSSSIVSYDKPESCCCNGIPETIHCWIKIWEADPSGSFPDLIRVEHNLDLSFCYDNYGGCSVYSYYPPECQQSSWAGSFSVNSYEYDVSGPHLVVKNSTVILLCAEYCNSFFIGGSLIGGETILTQCPPRVNEVETSPGSPAVAEVRCYW